MYFKTGRSRGYELNQHFGVLLSPFQLLPTLCELGSCQSRIGDLSVPV